jgi:hypothetical protein
MRGLHEDRAGLDGKACVSGEGPVVFEHRYPWGGAYRDGRPACRRVTVTIGRDGRLDLAPQERRYIVAQFEERLDPDLRRELSALVPRRGAAAARIAESLEPIEVVVHDRNRGPQRLTACIRRLSCAAACCAMSSSRCSAALKPLVPRTYIAFEPCSLGQKDGIDIAATPDLLACHEHPEADWASEIDPVRAQRAFA